MKEIFNFTPESINSLLEKESTSSFQLKIAREEDVDMLVPLINSAYNYENEGEKAFKEKDALRTDRNNVLQSMGEGVIIAASNQLDQTIGCFQYKEMLVSEGSVSSQDTNAYFGMLAVDPALQRQGAGSKFVTLAEEIGRVRGKSYMEIQVVNHSFHLVEWYKKLGYRKFGTREWDAPFLTKPTHFILFEKPLYDSSHLTPQ